MVKKIIIIFLVSTTNLLSQFNYDINGYLQNMQTTWSPKTGKNTFLSNSINNRINFAIYYSEKLTIRSSIRNIFDYGQFVNTIPNYQASAVRDNGYLDLTKKILSGNSYILYSNIDRLNMTLTLDKLEIELGRQRINWGINPVWTPNDIFNSASFINFDYVEKPGSDALRMQYYFDYASSLELVGKINSYEDLTFASKFQISLWDYDFQFIGGISKYDYIFAGGWSGNISGAGFTGELTYFNDRNKARKHENILVSSIGSNYMFSNSLFIACEFLYNSSGKEGKSGFNNNIFDLDYSAKNLSPSKYSVFGQIQYPITPLINFSLAAIINPSDKSFFLSPATEFSLNEDVFLLITGQFFIGDNFTEWGEFGEFYFMRLKWNF